MHNANKYNDFYKDCQDLKDWENSLLNLNNEQKNLCHTFSKFLNNFEQTVGCDPLLADIPFEFMISGGAIRDLLLGNIQEIKDIDLFFAVTLANIDGSAPSGKRFCTKIENTIKQRCLENNLYTKETIETVRESERFLSLLKIVVSKYFNIEKMYVDKSLDQEPVNADIAEYVNCGIQGVFKITTEKLPFNIDLIVVANDVNQFVMSQFDYGICKASFYTYQSKHKHKVQYDHHDPEINQLPYNFYLDTQFLKDSKNKTLTYNVSNLGINTIENSLFNHLGRILKKYPNYSVKIENGSEVTEGLLKKALLFHQISNATNNKTVPRTKTLKV